MANVTGGPVIESEESMSPGALSKAHRISKRSTIWLSCFIAALVLTLWMMLVTGQLGLDLDIGGIEDANPYITVFLSGFIITGTWYVVVFALSLPFVYLWHLIRKNRSNP